MFPTLSGGARRTASDGQTASGMNERSDSPGDDHGDDHHGDEDLRVCRREQSVLVERRVYRLLQRRHLASQRHLQRDGVT